jgi:hypothetical protein
MSKLRAFALRDKLGNTVSGSLVYSTTKPKNGDFFLVVEGVERNEINPDNYSKIINQHYSKATTSENFGDKAKAFISNYGYAPSNVLLSDSICSDDVDGPIYADVTNIGQTPSSLNEFLGAFMSGGLAGYPHTGTLGIAAWASHATTTTNGALFLINMPHIGISIDNQVGRIKRRGKASNGLDNTCGAVATAIAWVMANAVAPVIANFPDDYQNFVLCDILFPFKAAITALPTYGARMIFSTEKIRIAGDTFLTGATGISANVPANIDVFYCSGTFINTDDTYSAYIDVTSFKKFNNGWTDLTAEFLKTL